MKILIKPRFWMERQLDKNPDWFIGKAIISIFSKDDVSPFPDRFNIIKLNFDDVTDKDRECCKECIFFDEDMGNYLKGCLDSIHTNGFPLFIHCDAGVSRSGAIGYILNEWFNKYLEFNPIDIEYFKENNSHIQPNPLVVRIMKDVLWGKPTFANIEVNDYTFNEDEEKINNIEMI